MSVVTNILILTSSLEGKELPEGEESYPAIESLNQAIVDYGRRDRFEEISRYAGGCKVFERRVFAAAFNMLNDEWFRLSLDRTPWIDRDSVQVLMSEHEQEGFTLFWGMDTAGK